MDWWHFSFFLWLNNIPLCVCVYHVHIYIYVRACIYIPCLLYPFLCWWTFRLLPSPGYCKQCISPSLFLVSLSSTWTPPPSTSSLCSKRTPPTQSFLSCPSRISSSFEFRTWDPEGVIFYGDTNPKNDWFMLGLRDGRPEIQLHNHWAQLTVSAGPRLDDGRWHQVSQIWSWGRHILSWSEGRNGTKSLGIPLPLSPHWIHTGALWSGYSCPHFFQKGVLRLSQFVSDRSRVSWEYQLTLQVHILSARLDCLS